VRKICHAATPCSNCKSEENGYAPPASLLGSKDVLCFLGSANRASLSTSTARYAGICIDLILAVTFGDAAHRASFNASAACYAIVTDLVCHLNFLLLDLGYLYPITIFLFLQLFFDIFFKKILEIEKAGFLSRKSLYQSSISSVFSVLLGAFPKGVTSLR
jgi:hypothetical protein